MPSRKTMPPPEVIDGPECVRAASTGFTVLVLGGLMQLLVARIDPAIASAWLPLVSVAAYSVAGRRIGRAARPGLHGMVAALGAWALVLPLRLLAGGLVFALQIAIDLTIAAIIGAVAGALSAQVKERRRDHGIPRR